MVNPRIRFTFLEIDSDAHSVILNCMRHVPPRLDTMEGKMAIFTCEASGTEAPTARLLVGREAFVSISEGNLYNTSYLQRLKEE